jgi:hypothetical protein
MTNTMPTEQFITNNTPYKIKKGLGTNGPSPKLGLASYDG